MSIHLYNTLSRRKEKFESIEENKVRLYVCGPTVYADAHVGHAMVAIVFDMVQRYLTYRGYDVHYVTNFTDVDDKIIRRANEAGQDPLELANHYATEYLRHLDDLNIEPANHYPRVSEEIEQIIHMIQELGEKEYAYELEGDVYFRVKQDDDYGKLSQRKVEDARSGTRVEKDNRKEEQSDFALWKAAKPGELSWDSPWGKGRPGWHIECSAMCLHHLGETIDIHGGGNDLVFPHHENEIAQSESLTGKSFANYWMHNGMLQLAGEKMSKSLGNLVTIDKFLETRSPDVLRLLIFSGHYRKPVVFNDEALDSTERSLARLQGGLRPATGTKSVGAEADTLRQATEQARANFVQAMDDDLNTSSGLAAMFELVTAINTARSADVCGPFYEASQKTLRELGNVLGLALAVPEESVTQNVAAAPFIELLIELRKELRGAKQWALADKVRGSLQEHNVVLEDTRTGTTWRIEEQ